VYYDITMNNHTAMMPKQIDHLRQSVNNAVSAAGVQCEAISYIFDTRTTNSESVTIHRLLMLISIPEGWSDQAYDNLFPSLWHSKSPYRGLMDVQSLFDENLFIRDRNAKFPRLDEVPGEPPLLQNAEGLLKQWHSTFWSILQSVRQRFETFDHKLAEGLRKQTTEANRIFRQSVTSSAVMEHMNTQSETQHVWSLSYNSQPVSMEFQSSQSHPSIYYVFANAPKQPLLAFHFMQPQSLEPLLEPAPPTPELIPMTYEDPECLVRELEQIGLHKQELKNLQVLYSTLNHPPRK
jgi:hypothetical protein